MHIKATVKASSAKDSVSLKNGRCHIATREKAEGGRANAAARILLAKHLGVPQKSLSLIRGSTRPSKIFLLRG